MPRLGRKTPCAECPWLRKSARGYLGDDEPIHFYQVGVTAEGLMPCHTKIDYADPDWVETQLPEADFCAGNLIYFNNHMKRPRRRELAEAVDAVGTSPHVFQWANEFIAHHLPGATDEEVARASREAQFPPME